MLTGPGALVELPGTAPLLTAPNPVRHAEVLVIDIGEIEDPLSAMLSLTTAFPEETRLIGIGTINDIAVHALDLERKRHVGQHVAVRQQGHVLEHHTDSPF